MTLDDATSLHEHSNSDDPHGPPVRHPLLAQADLQRVLAEGRNRLRGVIHSKPYDWERPANAAILKRWMLDQARLELSRVSIEWPYRRSIAKDDTDELVYDGDLLRPLYNDFLQHDDGGDELADTSIGIDEYFRKITQVELLSAKEEIALSMRIESGLFAKERLEVSHDLHSDDEPLLRWLVRDGARANETMLLANTRLAANIARSYQGQGLELADLIQVGNLGLIRAIQKFDYKLGYKFSTYATWWIRQQISRSIADLGRTIRLPVHVVDHLRKVQAARRVLESGSPETANTSQISGVSGLGESLVTSLRSWSEDVFSLEYIRDELGEEIVDDGEDVFLSVENRLDLKRLLDMVLGTMSEKEAQVFALRHGLDGGDPQTLEQIGACQGLTRERIRQIETKAAKRARFQIAPDL